MRDPDGVTPKDLRGLYEERTGLVWSDDEGVAWLSKNYEHLDIYTKIPVLDKSAHTTLSDKVSWLSQQRCHVCRPDGEIAVIHFRISPESWQALGSVDKRAFKAGGGGTYPPARRAAPRTGYTGQHTLPVPQPPRALRPRRGWDR